MGESLVLGGVARELDELGGVVQVLQRALRSLVQSASGIASPAVVTTIEEVVGVGVGGVLHAVVALAVEPVVTLEHLGPGAGLLVLVNNKEGAVEGQEGLDW